MSNLGSQLDRLVPKLSGRERAIIVLRTFKEGKPQDHGMARGMGEADRNEYNRLMRLLNVCNTELVSLILAISLSIDKLQLRLAWLFNLTMWEIHTEELNNYLAACTKEPVTASEYKKLEGQAKESFLPVERFAYVLTSLKEDWTEDDLEDVDNSIVKAEVWELVEQRHAADLKRLANEGVLEARGKGKALRIKRSSFFTWQGLEAPVLPEWGAGYDVLPDGEAEEVAANRERRDAIRKTLGQILHPNDESPWWAVSSRRLQDAINEGLKSNWGELRTLEVALNEVAEQFGGEDILKPLLRQDIDDAKQKASDIHTAIQDWTGPLELPEPDPVEVEQTRDLINKWADNRR